MSMWTAIVLIVVAAMAGEAFRHHTKSRASNGADKAELDRLRERMDATETELRDRIETLERIVTDDKADLKRKFDYLDKAS